MRTNSDTWTITQSVGRTALLVALGRALETRRADALISDTFAEEFVTDAGDPTLTSEAMESALADGGDVADSITMLRDMMAARTLRIDSAVAEAIASGCTQAVILASGLAARPYRLPWSAGTRVFEVDQPAVIDFKNTTLSRLGATTDADRIAVSADLRDDWIAALREAGLRDDVPTVWLAEGLLPYLGAPDQEKLVTTIGTAAPTGSVLILDVPRGPFDTGHVDFDGEAFGVTMDELFLDTGEFATQEWLDGHGWTTTADSLLSLLDSYGRTPAGETRWTSMQSTLDLIVARRD